MQDTTSQDFQRLLQWKTNQLSIDTEFSNLNPFDSELYVVQLANKKDCVVLEWHKLSEDQKNYVITLIADDNICKVGHNIKIDLEQLAIKYNIFPKNVYDTMIGHTILFDGMNSSASLLNVVEEYLNIKLSKDVRNSFINRPSGKDLTDEEYIYCANDVKYLSEIKRMQEKGLKKYNLNPLSIQEQELIPNLVDIELRGIRFDDEKWLLNTEERKKKLEIIKKELYVLLEQILQKAPEIKDIQYLKKGAFNNFLTDFSVNSPIQLGILLKHLISIKDTNSVTLEEWVLKATNNSDKTILMKSFIKLLLSYREVSKSVSTYGEKFLEYLGNDGRIRTCFKQNFISTGRLSSGDISYTQVNAKGEYKDKRAKLYVNFQNIPKNNEYRHCFIADSNYKFVTCDLSGCEVRIIAGLSQDPLLLGAVLNGEDLHSLLATTSFRIITKDPNYIVSSDVNVDKRTLHKPVLFGLLYGAAAPRIATLLNIPLATATLVYEAIRSLLKPCFDYLAKYSEESIKKGYAIINSITNRRVWLGDLINHRKLNIPYKTDALTRQLYNLPMQGTNADIMKTIINKVNKEFSKKELQILGTVHDELNFQVIDEAIAYQVKDLMEETSNIFLLPPVTMKASMHIGNSWTK